MHLFLFLSLWPSSLWHLVGSSSTEQVVDILVGLEKKDEMGLRFCH